MNSKRLVTFVGFIIVLSFFAGYAGPSRAAFSSTNETLELSWIYTGVQTGCKLGTDAIYAGDLNNDGFSDIAVSAPKGMVNIDREGVVYVFYGRITTEGPSDIGEIPGGYGKYVNFGASIAAGDVNCDGIDDLIVGAPEYKAGDVFPNAGIIHVYYGSQNNGVSTVPDWTFTGPQRDIFFGSEIAADGDINGDGCKDLAVGAPMDSDVELNEGRVYLFLGSHNGPVTDTVQIFEVNQVGALFGSSISIAGDVNHDGNADLLIGAPQYNGIDEEANLMLDSGAAFLFYGTGAGTLSSTPDWSAFGENAEDEFGSALDSAGDVNGDSYADVIIGSPGWEEENLLLENEGRVQSYLGSAAGLATTSWWYATGNGRNTKFGSALSTTGDVTGDGISDLAVGAPYAYETVSGTSQDEPEAVYVYEGTSMGFFSNPTFTVAANQSSTDFGFAVDIVKAGTKDDPLGDLVIGAPDYFRDIKDKLGQAFVYNGKETSGEAPLAVEMLFPLVLGVP